MKATGIVRRIDDLGRVVIPKEIRRTLRIREGDPLEIYTDTDGEVIFKKYSPVGELSGFASQYAEVLAKISGFPILISDRDHIVAVAGVSKKEYLERRVTSVLEDLIENRQSFFALSDSAERFQAVEGIDRSASIIYPIIAAGDVTGSIIMLYNEQSTPPTETENKLMQTAAAFLGRQMEE
ncbi:MAG: stage V sporulation T C-terminal domain-containing protein [Clostridia bacterium]|nr:stage V sporulation T C-terminal domain-containing protein [Clostridia bacterium]